MPTVPSSFTVVVPPAIAASTASWVRPCRSTPPAAASGARSGAVRSTWAVMAPPVSAWPVACSSGWDRLNVTGRAGVSSLASAWRTIGAAASRSGFGPGMRSPVAVACNPAAPWLPCSSAVNVASRAPPAASPATSRCPEASGRVNGPCTCASSAMVCQDTPGAGVIAGARAATSRSADCPARSTVPFAVACAGPAVRSKAVASAVRGPSTLACSVIAPMSGSLAMLAIRPRGGSFTCSRAARCAGSILPWTW